MKDVDLVRVRDLMGNIAKIHRRLRELGQVSGEGFLDDFRNRESAKYLLMVRHPMALTLE